MNRWAGMMLSACVLATGLSSTAPAQAQTVTWTTFQGSGSSQMEYSNAIARDAAGYLYVAGVSRDTWGSPVAPFVGTPDLASNGHVVKLDPDGNVVWSTFIGGGSNYLSDIAVYNGDVYVVGGGSGFSNPGTFVGGNAAAGGFMIARLNGDTGARLWHTQYGADAFFNSYGAGIAVDASGIYASGSVAGQQITGPAPGNAPGVDTFAGGDDAVLLKLDFNGSYVWHTHIGSALNDAPGKKLALDGGSVYMTGKSQSSWGAAPLLPKESPNGFNEMFVAQFDKTTGARGWNTFPGDGTGLGLAGNSIAFDPDASQLLVTGETYTSTGFGAGTPVDAYTAGNDGVVLAMSTAGAIQWHTFVGGASADYGFGVTASAAGPVIAGRSGASWGSPLTPFTGSDDAFVLQLSNGGARSWHAFLGSAGSDYGYGVATGPGQLFLAGMAAGSFGDPVLRAYSAGGGSDGFVTALSTLPAPAAPAQIPVGGLAGSLAAGLMLASTGLHALRQRRR